MFLRIFLSADLPTDRFYRIFLSLFLRIFLWVFLRIFLSVDLPTNAPMNLPTDSYVNFDDHLLQYSAEHCFLNTHVILQIGFCAHGVLQIDLSSNLDNDSSGHFST